MEDTAAAAQPQNGSEVLGEIWANLNSELLISCLIGLLG